MESRFQKFHLTLIAMLSQTGFSAQHPGVEGAGQVMKRQGDPRGKLYDLLLLDRKSSLEQGKETRTERGRKRVNHLHLLGARHRTCRLHRLICDYTLPRLVLGSPSLDQSRRMNRQLLLRRLHIHPMSSVVEIIQRDKDTVSCIIPPPRLHYHFDHPDLKRFSTIRPLLRLVPLLLILDLAVLDPRL